MWEICEFLIEKCVLDEFSGGLLQLLGEDMVFVCQKNVKKVAKNVISKVSDF
jgi:hypothetical protein